jgi:hypothetical protein
MSVLGQSLTNVIVVIALVIAPGASRVVRGTVLALSREGRRNLETVSVALFLPRPRRDDAPSRTARG